MHQGLLARLRLFRSPLVSSCLGSQRIVTSYLHLPRLGYTSRDAGAEPTARTSPLTCVKREHLVRGDTRPDSVRLVEPGLELRSLPGQVIVEHGPAQFAAARVSDRSARLGPRPRHLGEAGGPADMSTQHLTPRRC